MRNGLVFLLCILVLFGCSDEKNLLNLDGASTSDESLNKPDPTFVTLSGTINYQDRIYNNNGFISNNLPMKAARFIELEVISSQNEILATGVTDSQGYYEFSDIPTGLNTLRIKASSTHTSGAQINIKDLQGLLYAVEQDLEVTETATIFDIALTAADRVGGLFNMLDVFYVAFDYVDAISEQALVLNDLNVIWQWGSSEGSFNCRQNGGPCSQGAGIYVLSDPVFSGDTDEYDDDVLLHEFAHHIEASLLMFDSPGGSHSLTNSTLDLRLAWSEGLASFFAVSAKKWLKETSPQLLSVPVILGPDYTSYYIDTIATRTSVSIDLENASSLYYQHSTNEAAVSSVLVQLQNQNDLLILWRTIFTYLTINNNADTLESFWDALVGSQSPRNSILADWQQTLEQKDIQYKMDNHESNSSQVNAKALVLSVDQRHSLYLSHYQTDEDWFFIDVEENINYTLSTFDLANGADTLIEVYDAAGNLVAENDDEIDCESVSGGCTPLHDGSHFSSTLSLNRTVTERLFVRVLTSPFFHNEPANYGYIGRYGSYSIRLE